MGRSGDNTGSLSRQFRLDWGRLDWGWETPGGGLRGHRRGGPERGRGENPVLSRLLFVEEGGTCSRAVGAVGAVYI
jgi:hypothetical protein